MPGTRLRLRLGGVLSGVQVQGEVQAVDEADGRVRLKFAGIEPLALERLRVVLRQYAAAA